MSTSTLPTTTILTYALGELHLLTKPGVSHAVKCEAKAEAVACLRALILRINAGELVDVPQAVELSGVLKPNGNGC